MAALELAERYAERGVAMTSVCRHSSPLHEALAKKHLPHQALHCGRHLDLKASRQLHQIIRANQVKTIVVQQLRDLWIIRPAIMAVKPIRVIGFAHIFLSTKKSGPLYRWLYSCLTSLIALTEGHRTNLLAHLPLNSKTITVIPNGIDLRVYRAERRSTQLRAELGAREGQILFGIVGRLDLQKGQIEAVQAAAQLKRQGHRFVLAIIGEDTKNEPGTKARLQELIRELNLEDEVKLCGFRGDIPDVVASVDVLLMPSWAETFGRVLLEAMASNVPLIATAAGGVPDIVSSEVNGLLVPPRNPDQLAVAMARLLKDAELRQSLAEHGLRTVRERYDIKQVQAQIDQLIF